MYAELERTSKAGGIYHRCRAHRAGCGFQLASRLPDYELPVCNPAWQTQVLRRLSLKSSNHCRAVEAAQSHPAGFARKTPNMADKLWFVAGCEKNDFRDQRPTDACRSSFRALYAYLAPRLDGSAAQPHHPYRTQSHSGNECRTSAVCLTQAAPGPALMRLELVFQETKISAWQKN
jgi:hypothetical protein